jgi:hypothetical protein
MNFQKLGTSEDFPEVGFLQQFSEPPKNFPKPLRSVPPKKQGCVWPLEFVLKLGIFFNFSYAPTWSNITYGHTLD